MPIPSEHVTLLKLYVGEFVIHESPYASESDVMYNKDMIKKMEFMEKKYNPLERLIFEDSIIA